MSEAIAGPGFLLQVGAGTADTGSFTTLAEVKDITGPAQTIDVLDVTNQDSPGGFEEIMPTIHRAGEVDFDVHFNPMNATHDDSTGLAYLMRNKLKRAWRLQLQDTGHHYWAFTGYVIGLQSKTPVAGVMTATTKIRISGQPLLKASASGS
jgi:predicted secreted protein